MKAINRIKKSEDFAFAIKNGTAKRNESFSLHVVQNELGYSRIGISVSARLGNAVERNRIKRQMRMMCHEIIKLDEPYDILVIAKNDFLKHTYQENKNLLAELLSQTGRNVK